VVAATGIVAKGSIEKPVSTRGEQAIALENAQGPRKEISVALGRER